MAQEQVSLTDELTGTNIIQTDHDGFTFTDLAVLILDAVLFLYTGWRSYHFLTNSVPDDMQVLALVGLWGLDIGMVIWSIVWMFGSTEKYQDWTAMAFFIIDLVGVVLTSLTDSLSFTSAGGSMSKMLNSIAAPAIPLIVVANVVAGFIFHMTSPKTRARREQRRADAEYRRKLGTIEKEKRDLMYAEGLIMAKQETLDKATILAQIKVAQDALEAHTRATLRDQVGIQNTAKGLGAAQQGKANSEVNALAEKLAGLKDALTSLAQPISPAPAPTDQNTPSALPSSVPAPVDQNAPAQPQEDQQEILSYIPFVAQLACQLNNHKVVPGDALEAAPIQGGDYLVRVAGTEDPFARLTLHDLARLMSGKSELSNPDDKTAEPPYHPMSLEPVKAPSISSNGNGNGAYPYAGNEESPS